MIVELVVALDVLSVALDVVTLLHAKTRSFPFLLLYFLLFFSFLLTFFLSLDMYASRSMASV